MFYVMNLLLCYILLDVLNIDFMVFIILWLVWELNLFCYIVVIVLD